MERKNVVLLTVIAVATLLTAMVGSTFAYFTATVNKGGNATEDAISATTATAKATYSDGSEIKVDAIAPGWEGEKIITITNDSSETAAALDYTISFAEFINGFYPEEGEQPTAGNFKYKLVKSGSGNANDDTHANIVGLKEEFTAMGATSLNGESDDDSNVLVTGHLEKGQTHQFTLTFTLENTSGPQDDQEKNFTGKLKAEAKAVETLAE